MVAAQLCLKLLDGTPKEVITLVNVSFLVVETLACLGQEGDRDEWSSR